MYTYNTNTILNWNGYFYFVCLNTIAAPVLKCEFTVENIKSKWFDELRANTTDYTLVIRLTNLKKLTGQSLNRCLHPTDRPSLLYMNFLIFISIFPFLLFIYLIFFIIIFLSLKPHLITVSPVIYLLFIFICSIFIFNAITTSNKTTNGWTHAITMPMDIYIYVYTHRNRCYISYSVCLYAIIFCPFVHMQHNAGIVRAARSQKQTL